MATKKFLDYDGLQTYDENIKAYVDGAIDAIPSETMIVNVTLNGTAYSADKTGVEIKAAIDAGKFVCVVYNKEIYYVTHCKDTNIHFQYQKVDITGVTSKLLACAISSDRWAYGDGNFMYDDIVNTKISSSLTTTDKTIVGAINELDSTKAEADHTHDDRYYTETEVDEKIVSVTNQLSAKADSSHTHDDRYYTIEQIDAMEFITTDDIDTICGSSIVPASEVVF